MNRTLWLALVCCAVAGASPSAPGEESFELAQLDFLAGCWQGTFAGGAGTLEEFYTAPSANVILGTTRYLREGAAVDFELTRIAREDDGVVLFPYPRGVASEHGFRLTSLAGGTAVFEAPEHDYPRRILYTAHPDGTRTARIDGGADDPEPRQWVLHPVDCPRAEDPVTSAE